MKRLLLSCSMIALCGVLAVGQANAQFGGPPPGGPGGPGGMRGRGPMFRGGMKIQLSDIPLDVLDSHLNLDANQNSQIHEILQSLRPPGGPGGPGGPPPGGPGGPGGPPPGGRGGRGGFMNFQKMHTEASAKIEALLSDSQKAAATKLVKRAQVFADVQIPMQLIGKMHFSEEQTTKMVAISKASRESLMAAIRTAMQNQDRSAMRTAFMDNRNQMEKQVRQLMTTEQLQTLDNYIAAHPRGPGGPGGPGGPPPGGFGGPPPGGPGGPPPPPGGGQ